MVRFFQLARHIPVMVLSLERFLQTGDCGNNGEGCTLIDINLENGNSTASISGPPYLDIGISFYNGCDTVTAQCTTSQCPEEVISCAAPNVDLAITFCD